ncbi:KxYKxGKxW signal peptide domain-containing protein [Fructobacillus evanidus]|uniref:Glucan-binding domain (YG repeat) n=1 Tax=Fructobacillus evanidus TaxID=3064281 RepID=A0ABN9Z0F5_9LACO|nr:Glucan-binding domain (YG repeat) [Fructobacillus sp. LMG 32999]CAK1250929.1 Glucan-binding domain (YG repeat) [Fructobacillus sp. LMG 32999]CAK1254560.1 Glucan-binding domain (YG repeat) [Fructobacillus sp. LMG 32999]CAK1254682.1 Glucan-binding domain (YG repeat) [Fructobacillus sp. LMG 32999]CAK1254845.1 Glucan-binding domain (YG repeat) [Fructobacillus sp. LMG 32999]
MRKKLYKSGKIWVAAAAASVAVLVGGGLASADTVSTDQNSSQQKQVVNTSTTTDNQQANGSAKTVDDSTTSANSNAVGSQQMKSTSTGDEVSSTSQLTTTSNATNSQTADQKSDSNTNQTTDNQNIATLKTNQITDNQNTATLQTNQTATQDVDKDSLLRSLGETELVATAEGTNSTDIHNQMIKDHPEWVDPKLEQNYHYNNPQGRSNDVTQILPHYDQNGNIDYWEGYYLWSNNTNPFQLQWYHFKTKDLSQFTAYDTTNNFSSTNVAIPNPNLNYDGVQGIDVDRNVNQNPIPWDFTFSGSTFANNSKANGQSWYTEDQWGNKVDADARIAYFDSVGERTYAAYSNDGQQFHPLYDHYLFDASIVGEKAGADFRDDYVIPVNNGSSLVAYMAGGLSHKIYILQSTDGVNWTNTNKAVDIGSLPGFSSITVESPNVTTINGTPIMFFGAQNVANVNYSGGAYVTGYFDNDGIFQINEDSKTGSVDEGFDLYGGNATKLDDQHQIYLSWLGNWAAFGQGHQGGLTLSRVMSYVDGQLQATIVEPGAIKNETVTTLSANQGQVVQSDNKITISYDSPQSEFNISLKRFDNDQFNISFKDGQLTVNRTNTTIGNTDRFVTTNTGLSKLSNIQFFLDNTSVEMYVPEIHKSYTMLSYGDTKNLPYTLISSIDAQLQNYQFDLSNTPALLNYQDILNNYQNDVQSFNKSVSVISKLGTQSQKDQLSSVQGVVNDIYLNTGSLLNDIQTNLALINKAGNSASKYAYIALVNSDLNLLSTKTMQLVLQLDELTNIKNDISKDKQGFYSDADNWYYFDNTTSSFVTGFQTINGKKYYFNDDGAQIKGQFFSVNGNWYHTDANSGELTTGAATIDGKQLLFDDQGVQIKGAWKENSDGTWSYYDANDGHLAIANQEKNPTDNSVASGWRENSDGTWSYISKDDGKPLTGQQTIDGKQVLFDSQGIQIKGAWEKNSDGTWSYYDANDGHLVVTNQAEKPTNTATTNTTTTVASGWRENSDGTWSYISKDDGKPLTGAQTIDGKKLLFDDKGIQIKGGWGKNADGTWSYYDANSGELTSTDNMNATPQQSTSTANKDAQVAVEVANQPTDITKNSDGVYVYKNDASKKAQGYLNDGSSWKWFDNGQLYTGFQNYMGAYYWFDNGVRQQNKWESAWGLKYYVGDDGRTVEGIHAIDGHAYDFGTDGTFNVKGPASGYLNDGRNWMWYEGGNPYTGFRYYMGTYYWFENGLRQDNAWHEAWGLTYYTGADGRAVQGVQNINGKLYYFGSDGTFFMRTNQEVNNNGTIYYANADGSLTPKEGYIWDGSPANGGYRWYEDSQLYTGFRYYMGTYYWFVDGVRQNQGWRQAWGLTYWTDADGRAVQGNQSIDGKNYYFGNDSTYFVR